MGNNDFSAKTENLITYNYYKNFSKFNLKDTIQFIYKEDLIKIILKVINDTNFRQKAINIANDPIKIKTFYEILYRNKKNKNFLKVSEFPIPKNTSICNSKLKKIFKNSLTTTKKIIKKNFK